MIQFLSEKYNKHFAFLLLVIFSCSIIPSYGRSFRGPRYPTITRPFYSLDRYNKINNSRLFPKKDGHYALKKEDIRPKFLPSIEAVADKVNIGGPSQPEMSSFKSVGADNMVNLFTGDFSYNIPLMDVGGYPINIFYNGGITMEQEASWVGLGWNINPGTISRNMRGVPDDFDGTDTMIQTQIMKPNKTWGARLGADLELVGLKALEKFKGNVGASLGISFNNYLGPALDLGIKGGTNFSAANKTNAEKNASPGISAGIDINLSSREGLTFSPNVSLTANCSRIEEGALFGIGLSTNYNSRSGVKALQLSDQVDFSRSQEEGKLAEFYGQQMSYLSTSISFAKPSYVPSIRMPLTNSAISGHFQLGAGLVGIYPSAEAEVYLQSSEVAPEDIQQKKAMVGYMHYENALNNPNAVMDFTRFNDAEVTPNTPVISVPQYTYDVFSIQGEGTGGSIRAYRNDLGYVRDNTTISRDKSTSMGGDIGPGHFGGNFNFIQTPSVIGAWKNGNKLRNTIPFAKAVDGKENVYFRNPGETSVLDNDQFTRIGGTDLVRFQLGGTTFAPTVEPVLERFSKSNQPAGSLAILTAPAFDGRTKRTQVTSFLTAKEASVVGLDTAIRSYDASAILDENNNLQYVNIPRVGDYRKANHISQVNVTESSGKRYIYGIPVYNVVQKDFTFTVDGNTDPSAETVQFASDDATINSNLLKSTSKKDGFLQVTQTPAYAHSFLLSALLSPDYVDVTGNGITEDDMGNAVKFNYTQIKQGDEWVMHKWRTPLTSGANNIANYNTGNRTETKDDKGIISYGERESWYLHSIESKTMIALFTLEDRADGKGALDSLYGVNGNDQSLKRLKKIDLYSKADLKKNGLANAKPIKTVWFVYNYVLCANAPDNSGTAEMRDDVNVNEARGKLTLESIYFTFNGKSRNDKNQYIFSYTRDVEGTNAVKGNPDYEFNASDRWGYYKSKAGNPEALKNSDFPYTVQDKTSCNQNAGAWALKKILLPSGGQLEVEYESDDYAFVQNRRAADMMEIAGLGNDNQTVTNNLYSIRGRGFTENDYVFIKVPEVCAGRTEVYEKYLKGVDQLAFRLSVNMPKGEEYVNSYATIADYGTCQDDDHKIWIKLNETDALSPLSLTALEYLREHLPAQAFEGYDVSESSGLKQVGEMLTGMFSSLKNAFKNPLAKLRSEQKAQTINPTRSFVRLNDPDGFKYGGGYRVKSIKLKDNWKAMTSQYTSEYGQQYEYYTTEVFNGVKRAISSGVASYEPSIGGEENPFHTIKQISDKLPLGPTSYGAIEQPVMDAFFPAPVIGYSKVTVRAIKKSNIPEGKKSRSGIGKQVTEFYTARDFPVYYNYTSFDPATDKQRHDASISSFFYKYAFDSRALSQGFVVETNDMHGKMKSQSSYSESDATTRISYTENFYRNTGSKGLDEKFDFVFASKGGVMEEGNMGIDIELMTDTREFSVKSTSLEIQGQVDLFPIGAPFWFPFVWPVSGNSENTYRAVTTTKVINYHGVLDSIVVIDKGSRVSTKNLVYDAETGKVVVTRTNNEFDLPVYNVSYPAYWAYSGMGPAYRNIDAVFSNVDFLDGRINSNNVPDDALESGDEVYLLSPGDAPTETCAADLTSCASIHSLWVFDRSKNTSSLTNPAPDFVFMDSSGQMYTRNNVTFRIIRSGKRNMLDATVAGFTTMSYPADTVDNIQILKANDEDWVINASAMEYREKWKVDNDVIKRFTQVFDPNNCTTSEVPDCNGYLEKNINPYVKGLIGNFRTDRTMVFYGSRMESDPLENTDLKKNGFLKGFKLYWDFNTQHNLIPDPADAHWVWNEQVTAINSKGLELETKNALDIFTAAQYGYSKSLPVAITSNSTYNEMFYEGLEDNDYQGTINDNVVNECAKKHIDFSGISHTQIVDADDLGFNAHTGRQVLSVDANSTASKSFTVGAVGDSPYDLVIGSDKTEYLSDLGGSFESYPLAGDEQYYYDPTAYFNTNYLAQIDVYSYVAFIGINSYSFQQTFDFYLNIPTSKNYTFNLGIATDVSDNRDCVNYDNNLTAVIEGVDNPSISKVLHLQAPIFNSGTNQNFTVFLCKGMYKVHGEAIKFYANNNTPPQDCFDSYTLGCSDCGQTYQSLTKENGCDYSIPIAAADAMLNPPFSIPENKKMVFSAWVKDSCYDQNNEPCSTFVNNQVQLQFNDGTSQPAVLKPSGPIVEGWQRYEGYFTAPEGASSMTMSLVNSSNKPVYFDDIRIHPFNANMKSYVYDPVNLRLTAELDANNYATFYEYDEEGKLVRTKAETNEGIKTINETRSFNQRALKNFQ